MSTNSVITCSINSVSVSGEITFRSASGLTVAITAPYTGFSRSLHIPTFARRVHNFIGEYGDERALDLLEELYRGLHFIYSNKTHVEKKYHQLLPSLRLAEQAVIAPKQFITIKQQLKKAFKTGDMSQAEYQRCLRSITCANQQLQSEVDDIKYQFIQRLLPRGLHLEPNQLFCFLQNGLSAT